MRGRGGERGAYSVSPIGKIGLPVRISWRIMPVMPIIAARPLLRSALSFHVRPRISSSSPTYERERAHTRERRAASRRARACAVGAPALAPTCFVEPSPSQTS